MRECQCLCNAYVTNHTVFCEDTKRRCVRVCVCAGVRVFMNISTHCDVQSGQCKELVVNIE